MNIRFNTFNYMTLNAAKNETHDYVEQRVTDSDGNWRVHPKLMDFYHELRKKFPTIEFMLANDEYVYPADDRTQSYRAANELFLYFPHEDYIRGRIAFHDTRVDKSGATQNRYAVYSGHITNNKFDSHRDQYNMQASKNLATAVSAAKKYLLPVTPKMVAEGAIPDAIQQRSNKANEAYISPASNIRWDMKRADETMFRTLVQLRKSGVDMMDADMNAKLDEFIRLDAITTEYRQRKFLGKFIYANKTVSGQTIYNVYTFNELSESMSRYNVMSQSTYQSLLEHEIDEDTKGRVAVLSMAEQGEYVTDVGVKVNPTMYFVEFDHAELA